MQTERPLAPFEVYCGRCRVSFPVETRRCVHCGGPTGPALAAGGLRAGRAPVQAPVRAPAGAGAGAEEEAELETLGKPRAFSPLTLVWIVLIVGGYAMRSCSGQ